ncbi:hypothetical protein CYMTET_51165 [Cymbomonas tetramitiformis]|uniref:Uncharacterized protein n=1 Tax=Cymbomonas tetramitiformis TaxID=36881 RepID=A0AAE0BLP8_9CHLO|nr:hypothetical protein CYMTET_51165 [Cymbomonas tetramitiformis]
MLAMANNVDKKCDAVAPALDRCIRFFEEAELESAVEVLNFGLASGVFTPAVRDGQGKVTEKAILKPPARDRPAFVAALGEAAEQCVEVLVTRSKFKLPEVPQQSASENRTSDKRAREHDGENEEEEEADGTVFEEGEEVATAERTKKGKRGAGISPDDLARDEELKRQMDAFLMQMVAGYAPATGKGESSFLALREAPCAKLRKQIIADPVSGEMKSVSVPRLTKAQFLAQNMKMVEKIEPESEREHFFNYVSWIVSLDNRYAWADLYDFDTQVRDDMIAGRIESWDPIQLGFRFQYSFLETLGEASRRLLDDKGSRGKGTRDTRDNGWKGGKGEAARGKARKPERTWTAKFLALFTAVGVSLASYGVPEADHRQYLQDVEAVGAVVSPLTLRADRWAQAAWGLPGAEAVVRGIATGFSWQQAEPEEFFRVENYVPPEHEEKVEMKLQEEEAAGRMVRTDVESVPGVSALGIVLRVVDGKVKERIVHDLSRPVGLSVNDNCEIDKRRFQSMEEAFVATNRWSLR